MIGDELRELIKHRLLLAIDAGHPLNFYSMKNAVIQVLAEHRSLHLLSDKGGSFRCGRTWISDLCKDFRLAVRRVTSAASKLPVDWEEQGKTLRDRLAYLSLVHDIPPSLVVNMDQTGLRICPASSYSRAEVSSKEVRVIGHHVKNQITLCVASAASGAMLPFQCIFKGSTDRFVFF